MGSSLGGDINSTYVTPSKGNRISVARTAFLKGNAQRYVMKHGLVNARYDSWFRTQVTLDCREFVEE